jgi:hypothetical protein
MKEVFADNYDEVLSGLREGALVYGMRRRIGKTEAILDYAHELAMAGIVSILVHNNCLRLHLLRRWREKFGSAPAPNIVCSEEQLRGISGKVLVDELKLTKYLGRFDAATT